MIDHLPTLSRRAVLATGAAAAALPAAAAPSATGDQSKALTAYLDAQYEQELRMDPEEMTSQGRKDRYGELTPRTEAHADKVLAWRRKSVADMKARFDPA